MFREVYHAWYGSTETEITTSKQCKILKDIIWG